MNHKLTKKLQFSTHDSDGKRRNYALYFLNGVQILKQKIPFDPNHDRGYDRRTNFSNEYILGGRLYQTRTRLDDNKKRIRETSYPLSVKKLKELEVPNDLKIELWNA